MIASRPYIATKPTQKPAHHFLAYKDTPHSKGTRTLGAVAQNRSMWPSRSLFSIRDTPLFYLFYVPFPHQRSMYGVWVSELHAKRTTRNEADRWMGPQAARCGVVGCGCTEIWLRARRVHLVTVHTRIRVTK